jgi:hypothetical protein
MPKSLRHKYAANVGWANTRDRKARTEPGRRGFFAKLLAEHDGDVLRAENAYKAHFQAMALKSQKTRQAKAAARKSGAAARKAGDAA